VVSAYALVAVPGLAFGLAWSLTAMTALLRVARVSQAPWFPVVILDVLEAPPILVLVDDAGG
jgi:hypothetical protein